MKNRPADRTLETDVLILGSGAAGSGAAIAAKERGANVTLVDKGKLESSGNLGGGNDHFMAVLHSGPETDTAEALVGYYRKAMTGFSDKMLKEAWVNMMPPVLKILQDMGVELVRKEDGTFLRTVGFGQPGAWWISIRNGHNIKRLIAKKVRDMGIHVLDHLMVTRLLKGENRIAGCVGYDVQDGTFTIIRAKKVILAMGNVASRGWCSSTWNPYNGWFSPYVTGSQFVLPYEAGVKILNLDTQQRATLLPKGFGAPGMNGINGMGGRELNAMGERFMGKYDPMWENGLRINQINGTYQEMLDGNGPPFYMDMTHLSREDNQHLQYVLMPGDKATYLDYCKQKQIDFANKPLEVEISELSFGGLVHTQENMETNVSGLYNGCAIVGFSPNMCCGYYAGIQAANAVKGTEKLAVLDGKEVAAEKERLFRPVQIEKGVSYSVVQKAISQVLTYYMGYRRNRKGMEDALGKLCLIESYANRIKAENHHALMRANETIEVLKMAKLTVLASMQRKESGRAFWRIKDYPELNPRLNKPLVAWQENGQPKFSWEV